MLGSDFLSQISGLKRLLSYYADWKEDRKEKEDFDWLFIEKEVKVPKLIV
jgi:hypothetical protein